LKQVTFLHVRTTRQLREAIERRAHQMGLRVSDYMRATLAREVFTNDSSQPDTQKQNIAL
jgi:antitoxin component of RelBE/YafQ-DinJ toxin-antitoxin module